MGKITLKNVSKSFGATVIIPGHRPRHRGWRVRRLRRPVGLRQVHAAAADRRAGGHQRRHDQHRRPRRHRRGAGQAQARHGVPVLRALPAYDGGEEHRLPAEDGRREQGGRSTRRSPTRRACSTSPTISSAGRASFPAASASASPSAAPSCASPRPSCSTSRCPTSTRRCAARCGWRSANCTTSSRRR